MRYKLYVSCVYNNIDWFRMQVFMKNFQKMIETTFHKKVCLYIDGAVYI